MVFYQNSDNAEASGTGTTDVEEEDHDDFEVEDDIDEGLQQATENSISSLDAEDQVQPPYTDIYP